MHATEPVAGTNTSLTRHAWSDGDVYLV